MILLGATAALLMLSVTSCKKEVTIVEESSIVFTDDPPKEMFGVNQIYGESYETYITQKQIDDAQNRGYNCISFFDPNTNQYSYQQCGNWYIMRTQKFWGMYQNKLYVSKSIQNYVVDPNTFLTAIDVVKRKQTGIGAICNGCQNPFGMRDQITWVK